MLTLNILNLLIAGFLGYLIGRWGDNYLNIWLINFNKKLAWLPHHWIWALIIMIIGIIYLKSNWGLWLFFFGAGLFISDLKDFLDFKFFAPDGKTKKTRKFWHVD